MKIEIAAADTVLWHAEEAGLISTVEHAEVLTLLMPDFAFAEALRLTDSVHCHIKVDDVDELPHDELKGLGYTSENAAPGYIKYATDSGINLIFSSIPIAEDDNIPGAVTQAKPFLDHCGADLRDESEPTRAAFEALPARAAELGWGEVPQGGDSPVHCCHTQVKAKHWVYPPSCWTGWRRPIEFAFGELVVFDQAMGCALRPIDPAHPMAGGAGCCGVPAAG
ncbi:hypothetical protein J4573_51755 [Actinomadura barringtoniae]|uniref:Uncharacterized protein n=1 Tax=Actinomadura barringtoniae TaxID=1427535 RepID=A0A939TDI5_9ACTN|nr:hypothetical protein [Actinomadura barringtoniae]MBO2455632.1 hypothetical protein [Actinomadura barringtoniae]